MGHESISLRAKSLIGNIDLFALQCYETSPKECAQKRLPNATRYLVSTSGSSSTNIDITRNDQVDLIYIVGVLSYSMYSTYRISFTLEHFILQLQEGEFVQDHVYTGEFDYFSFYLVGNSKLRVTLTPVRFPHC